VESTAVDVERSVVATTKATSAAMSAVVDAAKSKNRNRDYRFLSINHRPKIKFKKESLNIISRIEILFSFEKEDGS
jgi:hypothetical protein